MNSYESVMNILQEIKENSKNSTKERTKKSKHPWFKYYVGHTLEDTSPVEKARIETLTQIRDFVRSGRSIKRKTFR